MKKCRVGGKEGANNTAPASEYQVHGEEERKCRRIQAADTWKYHARPVYVSLHTLMNEDSLLPHTVKLIGST